MKERNKMEKYRVRESMHDGRFYIQKFFPENKVFLFRLLLQPAHWEDIKNYFPSFSSLKDAKEWIKNQKAKEIKFKNGDIIHEYEE